MNRIDFLRQARTMKTFALALMLIGTTLIAEGFGAHVPKGYIYAAMAFSAFIEGLNMMSRRARRKKRLELKAQVVPVRQDEQV